MMTPEQQKLVEDNHNLIYKFLHRNNLSIEEYYDIAAIGLCKAAKGYNKNIAKFSTYAFKSMRNEYLIHYRMTHRNKDIPPESIVYYNNRLDNDEGNTGDTAEGLNYITSPIKTDEIALLNTSLLEFRETLSQRNAMIFKLCIEGYSQREIGKQLNISQAQVSRVLKSLKTYITK